MIEETVAWTVHLAIIFRSDANIEWESMSLPKFEESESRPHREDELLGAALEGSTVALGELLQSCRGYLLAVAERKIQGTLRIKVSPSDLVQETFTEGHKVIRSFRGHTRKEFLMWLRGIFINRLAHARRKYRTQGCDLNREKRMPNQSSIRILANKVIHQETPSKEVMGKEAENALYAALDRLPETYRQIIRLHHFDGVSFEEISRRFGRDIGVWRGMWYRALKCLQKELHDDPSRQ